jgi:hypothetical protein
VFPFRELLADALEPAHLPAGKVAAPGFLQAPITFVEIDLNELY